MNGTDADELGLRWRDRRDRQRDLLFGKPGSEQWPSAWREALGSWADEHSRREGMRETLFEGRARAAAATQLLWTLNARKAASLGDSLTRYLDAQISYAVLDAPVVVTGGPLAPLMPLDEQRKVAYVEALCAVRAEEHTRVNAMRSITARLARLGMLRDAAHATEQARRWPDLKTPALDATLEHSLPRETRAGPDEDDDEGPGR